MDIKQGLRLALVATAVMASVLTVTPANAATTGYPARSVVRTASIPDGNYYIYNVNSGLCLGVPDFSDARRVEQTLCTLTFGRLWTFRNIGGNAYEIRNLNTGRCLAIGSSSTVEGANAIQWPCNGIPDQTWQVSPTGAGFSFVNANSGKCLAIGSGDTTIGAAAIQWTCLGSAEQQWLAIAP